MAMATQTSWRRSLGVDGELVWRNVAAASAPSISKRAVGEVLSEEVSMEILEGERERRFTDIFGTCLCRERRRL